MKKKLGKNTANHPVEIEWRNDDPNSNKYDESNPLVLLPSTSKKSKTDSKSSVGKKPPVQLSKKQRKRLEKIVERREKKKNRAEILEELAKYQLPPEVFENLVPYIKTKNDGLRKMGTNQLEAASKLKASKNNRVTSSIKGANRKGKGKAGNQIFAPPQKWEKGTTKKDLNVLGFDSSSSSSSDEEAEEDDEVDVVPVPRNVPPPPEKLSESDSAPQKPKSPPVSPHDSLPIKNGKKNVPVKPVGASDSSTSTVIKKSVPASASTPSVAASRPARYVSVLRSDEIEAIRSKLPIIAEEQVIMEAITENSVVVLAGETGCGKTTQVPQFLYEAGYASGDKMIGITEPRRVAAMAMSSRVGKELNLPKSTVSYQIRFEGNANPKTKIKFMTDGVLLKEMERDFLLKKYSVIVIDEAHERSLYTDILIGLLSRCVLIRSKRGDPLKVVIMSATLRTQDFTDNRLLFKRPPGFIHVPARQYPVQIHFSKTTPDNYLGAATKRVVGIHTKLPPGGILVFVTGQQEVKILVAKLQAIFDKSESGQSSSLLKPEKMKGRRQWLKEKKKKNKKDQVVDEKSSSNAKLLEFDLNSIGSFPYENESDDDDDDDGEKSDNEDGEEDGSEDENEDTQELIASAGPLHVIPLYSMLPMKEQQKVFTPPPSGSRLCVVSTNIAETSLTIPSVRYVVDTGKVKDKVWDKLTGIQTFSITWCSKASASQRSGRAGRTGPGHCYRLYSSALYNHEFPEFSKPEILTRPVDDMILLMKAMSITKIYNFPFPTPPDSSQIWSGEKLLIRLGALELAPEFKNLSNVMGNNVDKTVITSLGKTMSHLPVSPRFSKMLAISFAHSVIHYIISLVAGLTVQEVLLEPNSENEQHTKWLQLRRKWAETGGKILLGDSLVLLAAVKEFEASDGSPSTSYNLGLRHKAMLEIRKLRKQLTAEIASLTSAGNNEDSSSMMMEFNADYKLPTYSECIILRQILLSGSPDKIARKLSRDEMSRAKIKTTAYKCEGVDEPTYLHSASVLKTAKPDWIVYQEAFEAGGKIYLRGITAIEPDWIQDVCPNNESFV